MNSNKYQSLIKRKILVFKFFQKKKKKKKKKTKQNVYPRIDAKRGPSSYCNDKINLDSPIVVTLKIENFRLNH